MYANIVIGVNLDKATYMVCQGHKHVLCPSTVTLLQRSHGISVLHQKCDVVADLKIYRDQGRRIDLELQQKVIQQYIYKTQGRNHRIVLGKAKPIELR